MVMLALLDEGVAMAVGVAVAVPGERVGVSVGLRGVLVGVALLVGVAPLVGVTPLVGVALRVGVDCPAPEVLSLTKVQLMLSLELAVILTLLLAKSTMALSDGAHWIVLSRQPLCPT